MPLSDLQIEQARACGDIVIEPFDPRNLGSDTYDVRLGEWYYEESPVRQGSTFNPFSSEAVKRVWGKPKRAEPWETTEEAILLFPGATILAHTQEFIGGVHNITTKMFARSSIGRCMVGVCKCAGRGDVGYFNRWTMEITSFAKHHIITLKVGMRIAQIEFLTVGETRQVYGVDKGKYQQGTDLQTIMKNWKPEMMLPRLYNDWELKG
jgi:dCTP deaminase